MPGANRSSTPPKSCQKCSTQFAWQPNGSGTSMSRRPAYFRPSSFVNWATWASFALHSSCVYRTRLWSAFRCRSWKLRVRNWESVISPRRRPTCWSPLTLKPALTTRSRFSPTYAFASTRRSSYQCVSAFHRDAQLRRCLKVCGLAAHEPDETDERCDRGEDQQPLDGRGLQDEQEEELKEESQEDERADDFGKRPSPSCAPLVSPHATRLRHEFNEWHSRGLTVTFPSDPAKCESSPSGPL